MFQPRAAKICQAAKPWCKCQPFSYNRLLSTRMTLDGQFQPKRRLQHYPSLPQRHISSAVLPIAYTKPFEPGAIVQGYSGRKYVIDEVFSKRINPLLCVYRASAEGKKFVIKNMIPGEYEYQKALQESVSSCPNIRTLVDGVAGPELFIFPFLETNLLQFSQKRLSKVVRKDVLKRALEGLAALHEKNIIHTDIKPNNIMLDYNTKTEDDFIVARVQIADLEDSVILPPGKHIGGTMCGNQLWRSPESWARAKQGLPSDIFSFGLVAIYVMLNDMVLLVSDERLSAEDSWRWILQRQISLFATETDFKYLLQWIGEENPFFQRLIDVAGSFDSESLIRKPFSLRQYVDPSFRDLVGKMTSLNPEGRITAKEALLHPWFGEE